MNRALSIHIPRYFLFALLGFAPFGCGPEDPCEGQPTRTFESEHFNYRTCLDEAVVGPEILPALESHLEVLRTFLGIPYEDMIFPINYVAFTAGSGYRQSYHSDGHIAYGGDYRMLKHELIHAYLNGGAGPTTGLLSEGAATSLSCESGMFFVPSMDWREVLAGKAYRGSDDDVGSAYLHAAAFSGHLLLHYDPKLFMQLYRRAPDGISAETFALRFFEVYQRPIDEVWRHAMDGVQGPLTTVPMPQLCVPVWECSLPKLGSETTTLGGHGGELSPRRVEVGSTGLAYSISGAALLPLGCPVPIQADHPSNLPYFGKLPQMFSWLPTEPLRRGYIDLAPGAYALSHNGIASMGNIIDTQSTVQVEAPVKPWVGDTCGDLEPIEVPTDFGFFLTLALKAEGKRYVKLKTAPSFVHQVARGIHRSKFCTTCDESECFESVSETGRPTIDLNYFNVFIAKGNTIVDTHVTVEFQPPESAHSSR
jgi:hypothetical protein